MNNLEEVVEQIGNARFAYCADPKSKNVEVARAFLRSNLNSPKRYSQARQIAEYPKDFHKESVKNKMFPRIKGIGRDGYDDLRKIFSEDYKQKIKSPEEIRPGTYLAANSPTII